MILAHYTLSYSASMSGNAVRDGRRRPARSGGSGKALEVIPEALRRNL